MFFTSTYRLVIFLISSSFLLRLSDFTTIRGVSRFSSIIFFGSDIGFSISLFTAIRFILLSISILGSFIE